MNIPTCTVTSDVWPNPVVINVSDFDEATMTLVEGDAPALVEPTAAPDAPAEPALTEQLIVMKSGTGKNAKFFISDMKGSKIEGEAAKALGIDETGYSTEDEAKAALPKA